MGTVGQVSNGTTSLSRQPHPSFVSAYTNGDYGGVGHRWTSSHADDRIVSHGLATDTNESRPASQSAGSATSGGAQSRPTTSQGMVSTLSNSLVPNMSRPESSGTELAPQPVMRHGFADAYSSEEYLNMLEQVHSPPPPYSIYLADIRCFTCTLRLIDTSGRPHRQTRTPLSSKTGDLVND
jgi:hypothetical protein